tara:strand:- start:247 stop:867 length:621 start_codon:yes stop_codon:yes gene_type:complete
MNRVVLFGDSIIDNKTYVSHGEFSVLEHLENISNYEYIQVAYDGHTTFDVQNKQLHLSTIEKPSHIVLSVGGNDLLQNLSYLSNGPISNVNEAITGIQQHIFEPLEQRFETIIEELSSQRANLLICTVYEGDLGRTDEFKDVLDSSKIMVSSLNDIVYKTAKKYKADVLELREIFISSDDYANPIEPSHIGGEKLAKSIVEWIKNG